MCTASSTLASTATGLLLLLLRVLLASTSATVAEAEGTWVARLASCPTSHLSSDYSPYPPSRLLLAVTCSWSRAVPVLLLLTVCAAVLLLLCGISCCIAPACACKPLHLCSYTMFGDVQRTREML